ncbi:putative clathrin assembly protein At5g35200 [Manihot esculenta]|uniref:putative clathrin assembly protein At5g35200 n=1 Tax=Manihot esculenta TaxID=3983 RepID=UPI000B5D391D|nr:putative clathrin assembly protein At5g35200 [Manihot esculenta]
MAASGNTQQTFRRAIGALKDSTKVGLAKVNSENKALDVAIVKATNHDEMLPKEKHILTIFSALSASSPRADVTYCINGLTKRLAKTHNWTVALKTLIVIHRALREIDHTFHEEIITYSKGTRLVFHLSHLRDDSSPHAWDYSAWVRAYALYLEELLACFCVLKYDIQKNPSRTKELETPDLLEQLPILQQLLFRLLACKPEGMAVHNNLIHYALSIVASESVKLYVTITDGVLNLVDNYFDMERHDAIRALEIYKKATTQGETLSEFFEMCRSFEFGRRQKFIKIKMPPASFLTAMEDYVTDSPHVLPLEGIQMSEDEDGSPKEISTPHTTFINSTPQIAGWEVALVTTPNFNEELVAENELAGELDKLTLDSLCDGAMAITMNQNSVCRIGQMPPNPFDSLDINQGLFYGPSNVGPATNAQSIAVHEEQNFVMMQQQQQEPPVIGFGTNSTNPFVDDTDVPYSFGGDNNVPFHLT